MNRTFPKRVVVALVLCLALVFGAVPAFGLTAPAAVHAEVVPSHALAGARDLNGLTDAQARAVIAAETALPAYPPLTVTGDGKTLTFASGSAIYVNVDAMLEQAYTATDAVTPFVLTPAYAVNQSVVSAWTTSLAKKINRKAKDAKRSVKKRRLVVSNEVAGVAVNKGATSALITAALNAEIVSPTAVPAPVAVALKTVTPKVTRKNIPKAILVVLSEYKIRLYKGTKIEKTYRCAIGQRKYPTPTGKFKVTGKVKNPVWRNPGSAWAKNMPARIAGGPNNPLGTRAIYISASGIRMHGIPSSENWSIGHRASHGCMRMHRRDAENFYPRVPVGITVWIVK